MPKAPDPAHPSPATERDAATFDALRRLEATLKQTRARLDAFIDRLGDVDEVTAITTDATDGPAARSTGDR